jgi:hypothetical protein
MRDYLPISLMLFLATAIAFLLQMVPYTGVFLMFVLAPYWSIILVNGGFIALAIEAATRKVPMLLIIFPIVWFGGYLAVAYESQAEFERLGHEIAAGNAGQVLAFSSAQGDIVVDGTNSSELAGLAASLIQSYDIPVAYEINGNFKDATHLAYRLANTSVCKHIKDGSSYARNGVFASWFHENNVLVKDICQVRRPSDPKLRQFIVSSKISKSESFLLPHSIVEIQIHQQFGDTINLRSGFGTPLGWWPRPVIGCYLDSGIPNWKCAAGFHRPYSQTLRNSTNATVGTPEVIAKALSLTYSPASQRKASIANAPNQY